jgi:uncharacterized membrane protein (DUF485 family)
VLRRSSGKIGRRCDFRNAGVQFVRRRSNARPNRHRRRLQTDVAQEEKENLMGHGPATDWGEDRASGFKTRIGIWMFVLYAIFYAGFVVITTFNPQLMGSDIGGLNLAMVYGFGLIIFALMLAFVYNAICSAAEEELNDQPPTPMSEED